MNLGTYMIECLTEPTPVVRFTSNPMEARGFQQAFTQEGCVTVFLLTEFGEGGFEKHVLTPEMLEGHINIQELQQVAKDLAAVMTGIEAKLAGHDFEKLLLLHTGQMFDAFQGNWSLRRTAQGLHVEYASLLCPFTLTVTGADGHTPWTEDDFWVCLNLPGCRYLAFWCVKGKWELAPEVVFKGEKETLVNS